MQISPGRLDIDRMINSFSGRKCHLTFSVRQDCEWRDDRRTSVSHPMLMLCPQGAN